MKNILCHIPPRAISKATRGALSALGYALENASPGDLSNLQRSGSASPDALIVDQRLVDELPDFSKADATPIVLLVGDREQPLQDLRISGIVRRPVLLDEIYGELQLALEKTPRRWPRLDTRLPARGLSVLGSHPGAVLSLSQKGCLFFTSAPIERDEMLDLQFAIPGAPIICTRARFAYREGDAVGLEFERAFIDSPAGSADPVRRFVADQLAS